MQHGVAVPDELFGIARQAQVWETLEECAERDLTFQAGQRCSQAVMDALAKGEVLILLTRNIQQFGIRELLWIGIGGDQGGKDHFTFADHFAVQRNVLSRPALVGETQRGGVTQQFLDG